MGYILMLSHVSSLFIFLVEYKYIYSETFHPTYHKL